MTKEELKKKYEDHKEVIKVAAFGVITTVIAVAIGKKLKKTSIAIESEIKDAAAEAVKALPEPEFKAPPVPKSLISFGVPEWLGCWSKCLEFHLPFAMGGNESYPTKVKDLPALIDAIKDIPGVDDESELTAMFNIVWNKDN